MLVPVVVGRNFGILDVVARATYSAIIGAVLLEGDKVARAGCDSRLG